MKDEQNKLKPINNNLSKDKHNKSGSKTPEIPLLDEKNKTKENQENLNNNTKKDDNNPLILNTLNNSANINNINTSENTNLNVSSLNNIRGIKLKLFYKNIS